MSKKCRLKLQDSSAVVDDYVKQKVAAPSKDAPKKPDIRPTQDSAIADKRSKIVEEFGEDTVAQAERNVQRIIDESDVLIRVPSAEVVESIIDGGRFKSSIELNAERKQANRLSKPEKDDLDDLFGDDFDLEEDTNDGYESRRKGQESLMFGDSDIKDQDRPIYGYLGNTDFKGVHNNSVGAYGDIAIKLKAEAKERATVTADDSFNGGTPSRAEQVNAASFLGVDRFDSVTKDSAAEDLAQLGKATDINDFVRSVKRPYIEAQLHGQVKTTDIEEIHFTKGSKPSKKILDWAKQNVVKVVEHD